MRFSIVAGPRQRADLGQTAKQCWDTYVGDALLADELGFDSYMIGEHHFCWSSGNSAPFAMLGEIAAKTERIRVGTSVICAPFQHPLFLAENIAALDIASNGRFDFGVGVGSELDEFNTYGIEQKSRFGRTWEVIDIVEKCLSSQVGEYFDWEGKYYQFPGIQWIMQPIQERIPVFWGGFGPQGVTRAAKRGYNLIAPDFLGTFANVKKERGENPQDYLVGFTNTICIADTKEEAIARSAEACTWVSNVYGLRKELDGFQPPKEWAWSQDEMVASIQAGMPGMVPGQPGQRAPMPFIVPSCGTVDDMLEKFVPVAQGKRGLTTNLGISVREPGMSDEAAHNTLRQFAEHVMPVLKQEALKHGNTIT